MEWAQTRAAFSGAGGTVGPYDEGRPPLSAGDMPARRTGGPSGAYGESATYSLSPAVICVAEMSSPASEASRHFQSVKAGWS